MQTVNTEWLQFTKSEEERRKLKEYLIGDKITLDLLIEILYNRYRKVEEVSLPDYDSPSWLAKQAHQNGVKEVIRSLIRLCDLDQEHANIYKEL